MTDPTTSAVDAALQRRRFLRGGALLAAATGGALAATAGSVLPASAADPGALPQSFGIPPERVLDTTTAGGRTSISGSSKSAFDSSHRLKKNAWLEVALFSSDDAGDLISVYLNLTSLKSTAGGSLTVAAPSDKKPSGTTLSYDKGKTVSNGTISDYGIDDDVLVVRIWATSVTHVRLDLTGISAYITSGAAAPVERAASRAARARLVGRALTTRG